MPNFIAQRDLVLLTQDGQPDYVERGEVRNFPNGAPVSKSADNPNWLPVDAAPAPVAEKMQTYAVQRAIELNDGRKVAKGDTVMLSLAEAAPHLAANALRHAAAKTGINA